MEIKDGIVSMPEHEFKKTLTWNLLLGAILGVIIGFSLALSFDMWIDIIYLR